MQVPRYVEALSTIPSFLFHRNRPHWTLKEIMSFETTKGNLNRPSSHFAFLSESDLENGPMPPRWFTGQNPSHNVKVTSICKIN